VNVAARFVRALGYFTILPLGHNNAGPPEPEDVALLPLVGTSIGAAAGLIALGTSYFLPRRVAAAIAYGLPIALTGALHLDGFLDTCDAAFASVDLERRKEILRDPRHGSFAFAGGSVLAVASYASIADLEPYAWPAALALSNGVARLAALVVAKPSTNRETGTAAAAFARAPHVWAVAAQAGVLLALAITTGGKRRAVASIAIVGAAIPVSATLARRFGGSLGGDAYGFLISVADVAMLVSATA
jgi:adenosylcobinamide-GDP ribazoletransferase